MNNQIEEMMEMAREIHKALLHCMNNSYCRNCEFRNDTPMSFCKAEYIAKVISEKYQPKLPEDCVVLSREEFENNLTLYMGYKIGSKETAEKYDDKVVAIIQHLFDIGQIDFKAKLEFLIENEKILKQFGVEVKD